MAHTFDYAIIRLVPYVYRGDTLNVGLVVFRADGVDVRLSPPLPLLNYFNVNARAVDWIATRIKQLDNPDLDLEARARAVDASSGYAIAELGWFVTDVDSQYENRISDILSEYVDRPKRPKPTPKPSTVSRELKKIFREYEIYSGDIRDIDNHKVVSNMPVGPAGKLHVDFMLKNSLFHATETLDFSRSDHAGATEIKNAALASVTFQHARDAHSNFGINCYLVYSAPKVIEQAVLPALKIAQREVVDSFNLESREDKTRYIDIMLDAVGDRRLWQA